MKAVNTDFVTGIVGLAITALFWFARGDIGMLSAIFPNAILLFMLVFSLALLVKGFIRPELLAVFEGERLDRIAVVGVLLFAWVLGIRYLGFIVSSTLAFLLITLYMARMNRKVSVVNAGVWLGIIVVEVVVLYLIFSRVLFVPLPEGMFI